MSDYEKRILRAEAENRPSESKGNGPSRIFIFGILSAIAVLGGGVFLLIGGGYPLQGELSNDRKHIAKIDASAAKAIADLKKEACLRPAIISLLSAYRRTQMPRAFIEEVKKFEINCALLPEVRLSLIRSYADLSEFSQALKVAEKFVEENPISDHAWSIRSQIKQALGDLEGAAYDQRQALLLSVYPSRINVNEWYRLSDIFRRLGRLCEAITPILTYLSFEPIGRKTQQIETLISQLRRDGNCVSGEKQVEIRFPAHSKSLLVNTEVNGIKGRFVVDTGATTVAITTEFAKKASVKLHEKKQMSVLTANGFTSVVPGIADIISLNGLTAKSVFITVHNNSFGEGIDGLLGLSFISNFDFRLSRNALTMSVPRD